MKHSWLAVVLLLSFAHAQTSPKPVPQKPRRNVIIFVADGLRHGSVNDKDTPALWSVRTKGVHFVNSYSLFPTFTTANASAIATGHRLGDTGDFSNGLYAAHAIFDTGNFDHGPGTIIPFIENDEILADLDSHHGGNYLNEMTLMEAARKANFNTAAIGKLGPTAIQDIAAIDPQGEKFPTPQTILIDDATEYAWDGTKFEAKSIPLPEELVERLQKLGIPLDAPARNNGFAEKSVYANGNAGNAEKPGTLLPNYAQQQWMVDVTTRGILPMFAESDKPFVLLFWSRDPDASQHNQGDSFQQLVPGINGPTSKLGVQNADHTLQGILDWLDKHPLLKANTDLFVTSDHGFSTVSRRELDRAGAVTKSESLKHTYYNSAGQLTTKPGYLPSGFLAVDLAYALQTKLWDPDAPAGSGSRSPYKQVHLYLDELFHPLDQWESPVHGNGLLGQHAYKADGSDAMAIVAANGGSDLLYVPDGNPGTVQRLVKTLLKFDYVDNLFVDDKYGKLPGTLPLSAIDLMGMAVMPRPAIVVGFKEFYLNAGDVMQGVQISDTSLQEGQGNHGGFGRECTWNNMAAMGPDFKQGSEDKAPVGNADIVPTLAKILGLEIPSRGKLKGRVIEEALQGSAEAVAPQTKWIASDPASETSQRTVMFLEEFGGQKYFHSACLVTGKAIELGMCQKR